MSALVTVLASLIAAILLPIFVGPNHEPPTNSALFDDVTAQQLSDTFCFSDGLFAINMKFGAFTFDGAKAIDVAWDLVVGRGGQALLAWISYRLFTGALLSIIEKHPVSYELYTSLAFRPTDSSCAWILVKSVWHAPGWRIRFTLIWLILASAYVLSFPTVVSAMTGYVPVALPYFVTSSDQYLRLNVAVPTISFNNGASIGLDNGVILARDGVWYNRTRSRIFPNIPTLSKGCGDHICNLWSFLTEESDAAMDGATIANVYPGEFDLSGINSSWVDHEEAGYWAVMICPFDPDKSQQNWWTGGIRKKSEWDKDDTQQWTCPGYQFKSEVYVQRGSEVLFDGEWTTMKAIFDHERLNCVISQESNSYQWGFSHDLLVILLSCNAVWMLGMFIMWLETKVSSELHNRKLGTFRGAVDLGEAINPKWKMESTAWSDQQFREWLETFPRQVGLSYCKMEGLSSRHVRLEARRMNGYPVGPSFCLGVLHKKFHLPWKRMKECLRRLPQEILWAVTRGRWDRAPRYRIESSSSEVELL